MLIKEGGSKKMNKKQIAENIYKKLEVKKFEAYTFIDLLIEAIVEQLTKGDKVVISNFGTFKVVYRQKKKVLNPNNKKKMTIAARRMVKFLPSQNIKNIVRET